MNLITSRNNPKIKLVKSLRQRKYRQASGSFLVEGIHPVGEAVEAAQTGLKIEAIYFAPDLLDSEYARKLVEQQYERGLPCYATSAEVFQSISGKENPQGILAVVQIPTTGLEQISAENFPWGVALVMPQDPGNVGTILRTIDAVGASGLILLDDSTDPYHPNCVRASMGALFWFPVVQTNFEQFAHWVKNNKFHVYGTSARVKLDARQVPFCKPAILLLGSERSGLTPEQKSICDHLVALPMRGRGSSLNLAVAAGVMLYLMLEKLAPAST